jgi:hypothetical protein
MKKHEFEMCKYHKIQTVWLRDPRTKYKTLLEGQWAKPEFEYLRDNEWIFTEKIDGTNIRVDWNDSLQNVVFGGRTDKAQIPLFLLDKLNKLFPIEKFRELYPDTSMTLYGEGYGAKIQKGGGNYISDSVSFILFDVMINNNWLSRESVEDIANHLKIKVVPIVGKGNLTSAINLAKKGYNSLIGTQVAEGLVMKPVLELNDRMGNRIITKVKYKDFN